MQRFVILCSIFVLNACMQQGNTPNLALVQEGDTTLSCDALSSDLQELNTQLGMVYQDIKQQNYGTTTRSATDHALEYDARSAVQREMNRAASRTGNTLLNSFSHTGASLVGDLLKGGTPQQQKQQREQQALEYYGALRNRYMRLGSIAQEKKCAYVQMDDYPSLKDL